MVHMIPELAPCFQFRPHNLVVRVGLVEFGVELGDATWARPRDGPCFCQVPEVGLKHCTSNGNGGQEVTLLEQMNSGFEKVTEGLGCYKLPEITEHSRDKVIASRFQGTATGVEIKTWTILHHKLLSAPLQFTEVWAFFAARAGDGLKRGYEKPPQLAARCRKAYCREGGARLAWTGG